MPRKPRLKDVLDRQRTFIKAWRKHRDLTLEQLSEALAHRVGFEMSDSQLNRVERGESPYNQDLIEALAVVLRAKPRDLIGKDPIEVETDPLADTSLAERRQAAAVIRALRAQLTGTRD